MAPATKEYPPDAPAYPSQKVAVIFPEPSEIKHIQTEHLILRPFQLDNKEDAAGLFRTRRQQEVISWMYLKDPDASPEETENWMREKVFRTPDGSGAVGSRLFYFLVLRKADGPGSDTGGEIIGAAGINSLDPAPAVGYMFHPDVWGKGYATEAVRAVVKAWWDLPRAWAFDEERLFGAVKCANIGSLRVLEKAGFEVYKYVHYGEKLAFMSMGKPRKCSPSATMISE